jgi:hypothetical protein
MQKNEAFNILRTFSREELRKFRKFLNSEYFGKRAKAALLLEAVIKYHPMYSHVNLDKNALVKQIYPGKSGDTSTLRNLFSDLHDAALHFLMIKNFEASGNDRYNFLFNELMIKGLHGEFYKVLDKMGPESEACIDWVYFLNRHFRETSKFNFSHHAHKVRKQKNLGDEISFLSSSMNALIYFFVIELISLYFNFTFYQSSFDTSPHKGNISSALSFIDFAKLRETLKEDVNYFVLDLYESMLEAFKTPGDITKYHDYKKCVKLYFKRLSKDEKCAHYYKMITYCLLGAQNKFTGFDYDTELLQLYGEMLTNKYYQDRNTIHLPHELYRNILTHGIRIRNYEWLRSFVRRYSFMVFPGDRENMYHFGNAYLSFYLQNYTEALEHINNIELSFFIYKVDVKNLSMMIYYELGDIEGALCLVSSYKEFIRKNKIINPEKKKRYINFAKFTEKMLLFRSGSYKQDIGYLKHRLRLNDTVAFKPWITEKMSLLTPGLKKSA